MKKSKKKLIVRKHTGGNSLNSRRKSSLKEKYDYLRDWSPKNFQHPISDMLKDAYFRLDFEKYKELYMYMLELYPDIYEQRLRKKTTFKRSEPILY